MSSSFPFPVGLYRALGEDQVTVVAHDVDGAPAAVCVFADSAFERAAALVLLEDSPDSFVVSHDHRYFPDGRVEAYDPLRPWYAGELCLMFDMEWVTLGPQPRVHVFTHTAQEWECARQAMKHLLQQSRLSPRSYLEGDHAGFDQGLSAQDLEGRLHGPGLVAQFRDAAIRAQNEEDGSEFPADMFLLSVLEAKARRGLRARELDEEDERWEEDLDEEERSDEEELAETPADGAQREEAIREVTFQTSRHILSALARWRRGGKMFKRLM
jgi:hypothetical protein